LPNPARFGGDALGNNLLNSCAFQADGIKRILTHPSVFLGVGHGCRFDIGHAKTAELLKKPTLWFSTSYKIYDELFLRCFNEKNHGYY